MPPPLHSIRVVDLTRSFTGALASMILADAGADVVKIEPPEGEPTREHYAAVMWHRGKKSVVLDLKKKGGRTDAQRLAAGSDVVLAGFRPGVTERLGLDYSRLSSRNSSLIYVNITGFGTSGPYVNVRAYEGVVNAVAGRMDVHYETVGAHRPTYGAQFLTSYATALNTVQGIVAALIVRDKSGHGQLVNTSLLKSATNYDLSYSIGWQLHERGEFDGPFRYNGGGIPPYMTGRSRDGHWIQFGNLTPQTLFNFLYQLGLEWTLDDERYATQPVFANVEDQQTLQRMCLEKLLERDLADWMQIFMENDIAAEPFRTTQEGLKHPQAIHNQNVVDLNDPEFGATKQLGVLANLGGSPLEIGGPAPTVGADTKSVLSEKAPLTQRTPRPQQPAPKSPLEGIQVLEFASYIAAPYATALLADLGARVIKVEPVTGDAYRAMSFPRMCKTLQGKESLAIDMKDERGKRTIHKLLEKTDVLLHNFRPGVPERLRIDYETAKSIRHDIIYLYAGAYGSSGPHSQRAGFHPIAAAITGGPRFQLGKELPTPPDTTLDINGVQAMSNILRRSNESNPDPVAALTTCAAALLGLYHRSKTGKGQYIETSMLSANLYANADDAVQYEGKPERPLADADFNGLTATYRLYKCLEGWVFLACPQNDEWARLGHALGDNRLLDQSLAEKTSRIAHDHEIATMLTNLFAGATAAEWEQRLLKAGVPCVRVSERDNGRFTTGTDWVLEAGLMKEVEHPSLGKYLRHAAPFDFSITPTKEGTNCYMGEHTTSILSEVGFSADEVAAMHTDGAAFTHRV